MKRQRIEGPKTATVCYSPETYESGTGVYYAAAGAEMPFRATRRLTPYEPFGNTAVDVNTASMTVNQDAEAERLVRAAWDEAFHRGGGDMRRLVMVWVVDHHPDVPTEDCVLFQGQPYLTDETNEEITLGLGLLTKLEEYNKTRTQIVDKKATRQSGTEVCLEPARVKDISVAIVPLANFAG